MTKITEHFNLEEFKQPARHGFTETPYPQEWLEILTELCNQLEIIRAAFDKPVKVISGYRTKEYNTAISGAKDSQHCLGRAADIVVKDVDAGEVNKKILEMIKDKKLNIKGLGYYPNSSPPFSHIDIRDSHSLALWVG